MRETDSSRNIEKHSNLDILIDIEYVCHKKV